MFHGVKNGRGSRPSNNTLQPHASVDKFLKPRGQIEIQDSVLKKSNVAYSRQFNAATATPQQKRPVALNSTNSKNNGRYQSTLRPSDVRNIIDTDMANMMADKR